jgi:hypothetical protein
MAEYIEEKSKIQARGNLGMNSSLPFKYFLITSYITVAITGV